MSIPAREIGGVAVPVVGQGTWQMEHRWSASVAALRAGLDAGLTHVDTAEMYGSGRVEQLVGEAIAGRRDEVYLVSKVLPHKASYRGTIAACEASLRRLKTDHLDCYLLHWPGAHPLEQTVAAFDRLQQAGKIRAFGVSNFDLDELEQAVDLVGAERVVCNQVCYHLGARYIEAALLPWCAARGIAVVAYSPFGSGAMPRADSLAGSLLGEVARAHGVTAHQVALAFLLRHRAVLAIPKAGDPAHLRDNAAAAELVLAAPEIARLEQLPRGGSNLPVI
jgi:diketogulonate reductase-like aldo/keto reductase